VSEKVYLSNAFSISMLPPNDKEHLIKIEEVSVSEVKEILRNGFISAVGHESTAHLLSEMLETSVESSRIQVKLEKGDVLVIYQLLQRLPEGKVLNKEELLQLPHKWFKLTLF